MINLNLNCNLISHNNQKIIAVCSKKSCKKPSLCCLQCIQQIHNTHIKQCLNLDDFSKNLKYQLDRMTKQKFEIQTGFQSIINKMNIMEKWIENQEQSIIQLQCCFQFGNYQEIEQNIINAKYFCQNYILHKQVDLTESTLNLCYQLEVIIQQANIERFILTNELIIKQDKDINDEFENSSQILKQEEKISKQNQVAKLQLIAQMLEEEQKYQEAINKCNEGINLDPKNIQLYEIKGNVLSSTKQIEKSLQCFDIIIQLDKNNWVAYLNKGVQLEHLGKNKEAIECYERSLQLNTNNLGALNNLGYALNKQKQYQKSIEFSDQGIKLDPRFFLFYLNKAHALHHLKLYDEVVKCCDQAIQLNTNEDRIYKLKALVLFKQKKFKLAIESYDKAILLNPKDIESQLYKGNALCVEKKFQDAIVVFSTVIKEWPEISDGYIKKGFALLEIQQVQQAQICFQKAMNLKTLVPENYQQLQQYLKSQQQQHEAHNDLNQLKQALSQINLGQLLDQVKF